MEENVSASSRASFTVSVSSSRFIRVHSTQARTFSSVGSSRTAFSNALQNRPAILLRWSISVSFCRISFLAFSISTAATAACSRCSSGTSWS